MNEKEQLMKMFDIASENGDEEAANEIVKKINLLESQTMGNKSRIANLSQMVMKPVSLDNLNDSVNMNELDSNNGKPLLDANVESQIENQMKVNQEQGLFKPRSQVEAEITGKEIVPVEDENLTEIQKLNKSLSTLDSILINAGKSFVDLYDSVGEQFGLDPVEDRTQIQKIAFADLKKERPISTFIGELLPFVPAAFSAGGLSTLGRKIAASSTVGAAEGAAIAKGDDSNILGGAGIGAGIAGTAEVLFPKIAKLGKLAFRKLKGTEKLLDNGIPTSEFKKVLDESNLNLNELKDSGINPEDLVNLNAEGLRKKFFEAQGITPTRAQITQDKTDFIKERELAKKSGLVEENLTNQQNQITKKFEILLEKTGGTPSKGLLDISDDVIDMSSYVKDRVYKADDLVTQAYKAAAKDSNGEKVLDLIPMLRKIKSTKGENQSSIDFINSSEAFIKRAIKENKGKVSVKTAEDIVKFMNSKFDTLNPEGKDLLRIFKDTSDEIVEKTTNSNTFKEARRAKFELERKLRPEKEGSRYTRKAEVLLDMVNGKIDSENVVKEVLKKSRSSDIKHVKEFLLEDGEAGKQIWDDFRTGVVEQLITTATLQSGNRTPASFSKAIKTAGRGNLSEILTKEEFKDLKNIYNTILKTQPKAGTGIGKGSSGLAVGELSTNILSSITSIGGALPNVVSDFFKDLPNKIANRKALRLPSGKKPVELNSVDQRVISSTIPSTNQGLQEEEPAFKDGKGLSIEINKEKGYQIMARPIFFIAPEFEQYEGYYIKAYQSGTTIPLDIFIDASETISVKKLVINANGFFEYNNEQVTPRLNGRFDIFLFPSASDADNDKTSNALMLAQGASSEILLGESGGSIEKATSDITGIVKFEGIDDSEGSVVKNITNSRDAIKAVFNTLKYSASDITNLSDIVWITPLAAYNMVVDNAIPNEDEWNIGEIVYKDNSIAETNNHFLRMDGAGFDGNVYPKLAALDFYKNKELDTVTEFSELINTNKTSDSGKAKVFLRANDKYLLIYADSQGKLRIDESTDGINYSIFLWVNTAGTTVVDDFGTINFDLFSSFDGENQLAITAGSKVLLLNIDDLSDFVITTDSNLSGTAYFHYNARLNKYIMFTNGSEIVESVLVTVFKAVSVDKLGNVVLESSFEKTFFDASNRMNDFNVLTNGEFGHGDINYSKEGYYFLVYRKFDDTLLYEISEFNLANAFDESNNIKNITNASGRPILSGSTSGISEYLAINGAAVNSKNNLAIIDYATDEQTAIYVRRGGSFSFKTIDNPFPIDDDAGIIPLGGERYLLVGDKGYGFAFTDNSFDTITYSSAVSTVAEDGGIGKGTGLFIPEINKFVMFLDNSSIDDDIKYITIDATKSSEYKTYDMSDRNLGSTSYFVYAGKPV